MSTPPATSAHSSAQPAPPALRLNIPAVTLAAERLSGSDPLAHYPRLLPDLHASDTAHADKTVDWSVQGETLTPPGGQAQPWIHLQLRTHLPMTCQRCLGEVLMPLELDYSYRFVADEATAEIEDEASVEDILVTSRQFDLRELIEDELLMELPLVPKHEVCPEPVKLASSDEDFKAALTQKPNAFAVLGSLKKNS